jgi:hypothetical protein
VFCSTKNHDSLLMWAHYAQAHKGVVLRFLPDKQKTHFFSHRVPSNTRKRGLCFTETLLSLFNILCA